MQVSAPASLPWALDSTPFYHLALLCLLSEHVSLPGMMMCNCLNLYYVPYKSIRSWEQSLRVECPQYRGQYPTHVRYSINIGSKAEKWVNECWVFFKNTKERSTSRNHRGYREEHSLLENVAGVLKEVKKDLGKREDREEKGSCG